MPVHPLSEAEHIPRLLGDRVKSREKIHQCRARLESRWEVVQFECFLHGVIHQNVDCISHLGLHTVRDCGLFEAPCAKGNLTEMVKLVGADSRYSKTNDETNLWR
jgi:hypothetical protein